MLKLFGAIRYERQIELAYEGDMFPMCTLDVIWWWVGKKALKSTWKLTGFNGNTCNLFGVEPLNGPETSDWGLCKNFIAAKMSTMR